MRKRESDVFVTESDSIYLVEKSDKSLQFKKGQISTIIREAFDLYTQELSMLYGKELSNKHTFETLVLQHFGGVQGVLAYRKQWDTLKEREPLSQQPVDNLQSFMTEVRSFQEANNIAYEIDIMNTSTFEI